MGIVSSNSYIRELYILSWTYWEIFTIVPTLKEATISTYSFGANV